MSTSETAETSRYVRMRVELVLDITDPAALTGAALDRITADDSLPGQERGHAEAAVRDDAAEALAYLVDPVDLVGAVPGVELTQASWSSESVEPGAADADTDGESADAYGDDEDDWDEDGLYQTLRSGA